VGGALRFGVSVDASAAEGADPVADARHAESLGFDLLTVSDHIHGRRPTFETWTLLTWIAASTGRISVGTNVLGLPYRPPAVVAKMAESLDRLSGGRLVLGLGAGGSDEEFRGFGLEIRRPGEKIEALEEAVHVIRGVWARTPFTFGGRHFHTEEAAVEPKPARRIPIWFGTYGPRALALTGRVADGWIPSFPFAPPDVVGEMRHRVLSAAAQAGRDPDEVTCAYNLGVMVGDDPGTRARRIVWGPPDRVAEELAGFVRMGFTVLNLWPVGNAHEQRERLAGEVIPSVRAATD